LSEQQANHVLAHGPPPDLFPSCRLGALPDENKQGPPDGGVSSHGSIASNEPHGNELQAPSRLGGCVFLLLWVIGAICLLYWNYWKP
jgi:hypothetical protein